MRHIMDKDWPTNIPVEIYNHEEHTRMFTVLPSIGIIQLHTSKFWSRTTHERIFKAEEWVVVSRNMVEERAPLRPTS